MSSLGVGIAVGQFRVMHQRPSAWAWREGEMGIGAR